MTKNVRSLDTIANEIHRIARASVFEIGDLLVEAKATCEHGEWGAWLDEEFAWSDDTAERYMAVSQLATKFRNLRNLKLAKTTLYDLVDEEEGDIPAIIDELAKHATKKRLKAEDAGRIIAIGRARVRHGDHPDATLLALDDLPIGFRLGGESLPWVLEAAEALKAQNPTTDEAAAKIVDEFERAYDEAADDGGDHDEDDHNVSDDADGDDDGGDDDGGGDDVDGSEHDITELPPTPLADELLRALKIVLHYALRPLPTKVGGITGPELMRIADYVQELYNTMHGSDQVRRVADRAEARSRQQISGGDS
jgi:hypothetical protein